MDVLQIDRPGHNFLLNLLFRAEIINQTEKNVLAEAFDSCRCYFSKVSREDYIWLFQLIIVNLPEWKKQYDNVIWRLRKYIAGDVNCRAWSFAECKFLERNSKEKVHNINIITAATLAFVSNRQTIDQ